MKIRRTKCMWGSLRRRGLFHILEERIQVIAVLLIVVPGQHSFPRLHDKQTGEILRHDASISRVVDKKSSSCLVDVQCTPCSPIVLMLSIQARRVTPAHLSRSQDAAMATTSKAAAPNLSDRDKWCRQSHPIGCKQAGTESLAPIAKPSPFCDITARRRRCDPLFLACRTCVIRQKPSLHL